MLRTDASFFILCFTVLVALSGCSSRFASQEALADGQSSRYTLTQDKAPDVALSPDQIAATTPRKEPLSRHGNRSPYTVNGETYHIMASAEGYRQQGIASWYGAKFHGHATSNGETFDMYQISAAHKTLPLPTWVKVTNLDNGESINVRVNDRGPFHEGRIIDLSYAAAVKLGFQDKGTAPVLVEALQGAELDTASYYVQVGAFSTREAAVNLKQELEAQLRERIAIYRQGGIYRVRVGPVKYDQAVALQRQLTSPELGEPLLVAKQ